MEHAGVLAQFDMMGDISAQPIASRTPMSPPLVAVVAGAGPVLNATTPNNNVKPPPPVGVGLVPLLRAKSPTSFNGRAPSIFPRRLAVDVQFSDLTYTVRQINFTKRSIGKWLFRRFEKGSHTTLEEGGGLICLTSHS